MSRHPTEPPTGDPRPGPRSASLSLAELEQVVRAVDGDVLLVPPRILRRVIKEDRELPGFGYDVPHAKSYVIRRRPLLQIADHVDLGVAPHLPLPDRVLLLARPDGEELAQQTAGEALVRIWRLVFHARLHVAIQTRIDTGRLTPADIRRRIQQLGPAEFEEIRSVLQHEELLLPPPDDQAVYVEFAATYLELLFFDWHRLPNFFPGLAQGARPVEVLQQDVDAAHWFAATRPAGAPDPLPAATSPGLEPEHLEIWPVELEDQAEPSSVTARTPSEEKYRRLIRRAERAAARRNHVRALIYRARAEAVVPPGCAEQLLTALLADRDRLIDRLEQALGGTVGDRRVWQEVLLALVRLTTPGIWTAEAKLLYDLQKVCDDYERDAYTVDLVEWARSWGRRSVRRRLPHQRVVMMCKHLQTVTRRLTTIRLADHHRHQLSHLICVASEAAEQRLRGRLRPLILQVLEQVGLEPQNAPERVARSKLVEELLDRIAEHGFLTMGDLRDTISRNNLRLADCSGWRQILGGDQLLRVDARLADVLDGVYNGGEIYRRWMQHFSSWGFGTHLGRLLTQYLMVPFGGAYVILAGLEHLLSLFSGHDKTGGTPWPLMLVQVVLLGSFLTGLIHVEPFRHTVWRFLKGAFGTLRDAVVGAIRRVIQWPWLLFVLRSRVFRLGVRFVAKPLLLTTLIWLLVPLRQASLSTSVWRGVTLYLSVTLVLNSRIGRNLEELTAEWIVQSWQRFGLRFFANLLVAVMDDFKRAVQAVERVLYTVDEWLRFRSGQSRLVLGAKAGLGIFWFVFTYVTRFCVNLLIEPQVNPIKHFPVVTVGHKLLLPTGPILVRQLTPYLGAAEANTIVWSTIWLIPGIFGFLVWELKENWRLYSANRPARLRPVAIGHHGETLARLLRLGFHSGTLPKLYAKLPRAERKAQTTENWRPVRKHLRALQQVEHALRRFVERDFLAFFAESRAWQAEPPKVKRITLSSNRVRIDLACPEIAPDNLQLEFTMQAGWLQAAISKPGWLEELPPGSRYVLRTALLGLYKSGGVELIREQIEQLWEDSLAAYQLVGTGLVVWPTPALDIAASYDLRTEATSVVPKISGALLYFMPAIERQRLLFGELPLSWSQWVAAWEQDPTGPALPSDLLETVHVLPSADAERVPA